MDPSSFAFKEAFAAAQGLPNGNGDSNLPGSKSSTWPVLLFLGFIMSAPYLIMKLIGNVSTAAVEEGKCLYCIYTYYKY